MNRHSESAHLYKPVTYCMFQPDAWIKAHRDPYVCTTQAPLSIHVVNEQIFIHHANQLEHFRAHQHA